VGSSMTVRCSVNTEHRTSGGGRRRQPAKTGRRAACDWGVISQCRSLREVARNQRLGTTPIAAPPARRELPAFLLTWHSPIVSGKEALRRNL
jgi:hypothetical protein